MKIELLSQSKNQYKANLHCHSTVSDGEQSPEEIKEYYKSLGYSAVCYTDHEVLIGHKELCDEDFIALHGYEVAIKKDWSEHTGDFMPVYHLNLIAESQDNLTMPRFFLSIPSIKENVVMMRDKYGKWDSDDIIDHADYNIEWLNDYIKAVSAKGFLVTYNHPMWSLQTEKDYIGLEGLHAFEVFNGTCDELNDNTSLHYEQMLRSGANVVPVGGDDNHRKDSCGIGWTVIVAKELTYEGLINAYRSGDCYASNGPSIYGIVLEDGMIKVNTSDAVRISLHSEGRYCAASRAQSAPLTYAEFEYLPHRFGRYFRIEVKDQGGHLAVSRAYSIDELI